MPSPLDALLAGATMMSRHTKSPEEMANHLAYLQIDVSDPEFHPHMLLMSQRTEAGYRKLLDEAIEAKEIVPCDTARLARAISAMAGGSLISWAVFREGTAESWVRGDLETLLAAYRPARRKKLSQAPAGKSQSRAGERNDRVEGGDEDNGFDTKARSQTETHGGCHAADACRTASTRWSVRIRMRGRLRFA